jgi:hypothetical protein
VVTFFADAYYIELFASTKKQHKLAKATISYLLVSPLLFSLHINPGAPLVLSTPGGEKAVLLLADISGEPNTSEPVAKVLSPSSIKELVT